jgi:hypothetical protein
METNVIHKKRDRNRRMINKIVEMLLEKGPMSINEINYNCQKLMKWGPTTHQLINYMSRRAEFKRVGVTRVPNSTDGGTYESILWGVSDEYAHRGD